MKKWGMIFFFLLALVLSGVLSHIFGLQIKSKDRALANFMIKSIIDKKNEYDILFSNNDARNNWRLDMGEKDMS